MPGEDLKPLKRARNPPHNWVEQKGGGERERGKESGEHGLGALPLLGTEGLGWKWYTIGLW